MGLLHTFAGGCDASTGGDLVDDTPATKGSNCQTTCCLYDASDTCPNLPGLDPVDNYMSYAADNTCRTKFTTGQKQRMRAQYETYRRPKNPVKPTGPSAPPPPSGPTGPSPSPTCANSYLAICEEQSDCCVGTCRPLLWIEIPGLPSWCFFF